MGGSESNQTGGIDDWLWPLFCLLPPAKQAEVIEKMQMMARRNQLRKGIRKGGAEDPAPCERPVLTVRKQ